MMKKLILFSAILLAFVATPVLAAPSTDYFHISLAPMGEFMLGEGTGYRDDTGVFGSPWYYYENTGWYNQWFYDDPPDPTRYKEIYYEINIGIGEPVEPLSELKIALNWSTLAYPESGPDGPPPLPQLFEEPYEWLEDVFIVREVIFEATDEPLSGIQITGTYTIPDYNPEWVSIDIYANGYMLDIMPGSYIIHECVPAPGAILLGSIGVGLVGWLRRHRTI